MPASHENLPIANDRELLGLTDGELAKVDPLVMNLLVARSIPSLADLEIACYEVQADESAQEVQGRLPGAEEVFQRTPWQWKNDVRFFRLGVLCGFLEFEAGIAYNEEQRDGRAVLYTDPDDLFLHGVMDRRRGTCANMPTLHVALAWRLGWPVSLASVRPITSAASTMARCSTTSRPRKPASAASSPIPTNT